MVPVFLCLALSIPGVEPKSDFEEMTTVGLEIPGLGRHKLPTPTMSEGLSEAEIKAKVKTFVAERRYFLDRAPDAPFRLDRLKEVTDSKGKLRAREINLWFAARGTIKDLDDQNLLNALLGVKARRGKSKPAKELDFLEEEDLKKRGITPATIENGEERYSILDVELVEKVKLDGITRSRKELRNGSLITTMILDPRFETDEEHPNRWRKILDRESLGPPHPYGGFGGYVKATTIPGDEDIVFIEMHFVFAEPHDWFGGRNLIGAWLPTATKENVAGIRRKLASKSRK